MTSKMRFTFWALAATLRPIMNLLMGKKWSGSENLPTNRGFIVCPNHVTEIDPVVVGHFLYNNGVMPHFLAKAALFKVPVFGAALRGARQIPVERGGNGGRGSLKVAREVLDDGGGIVIYPEGTLTRDPQLWPMRGRTGAARLALETGAPVIPIAQWGAQEVFPRYAKRLHLFPRKHVRLLAGDPVDLSSFAGRPLDKATLLEATDVILDEVTRLLEQLRGEKAPAARWDAAANNQSAYGRVITRTAEKIEHDDGTPAASLRPGPASAQSAESAVDGTLDEDALDAAAPEETAAPDEAPAETMKERGSTA